MYTTNSPASAVEALETFEEARSFFDQNSPSATVTEMPVRVIAFDSERAFRPYSPNPGAVAFYQRGHRRDYIVMRDFGPGSYQTAVHEYTHLYIEHRNLHLPVWLNEGLADVYSTIHSQGDRLVIGSPPPSRLQALRSLPLLDLRLVMTVDQNSPYYRDPRLMRQFYSESWALAHMLLLGSEYQKNFRNFIREVNSGIGGEQSFRDVYGKSLRDVALDLRSYLVQGMTLSSFDSRLNQTDVPRVSASVAEETEIMLADLLATHPETAAEAHARLIALAANSPNNPDVQKSLGYLAWQQGKVDEAKEHFGEALEQGSDDSLMMYQYATLLEAGGAPSKQVLDLLERALALNPQLSDARYTLGLIAASQNQCTLAVSTLSPLKTITVDRAFPLYTALTYCDIQLGDVRNAHHWGELARRYAHTQQQSSTIDHLMQNLDHAGQ